MDFFEQLETNDADIRKSVESLWCPELKDYLYVNWEDEGNYVLVEQFENKLSDYGVYHQIIKIKSSDIGRETHIGYFKYANREEIVRRLRLLLQVHHVQMISQLLKYRERWNTQLEVEQLVEVKSKRPSQGTLGFIRCDSNDTSTWPEHGEWVLVVTDGWIDNKKYGDSIGATRFQATINGPRFWHDEANGVYWAPLPKVNRFA